LSAVVVRWDKAIDKAIVDRQKQQEINLFYNWSRVSAIQVCVGSPAQPPELAQRCGPPIMAMMAIWRAECFRM